MVRKDDFDWHENKRLWTLEERGLDFERVSEIFDGFVLEWESPRYGEERTAAVGRIGDDYVTVVYTWRGGKRRIISARPARRKERQNYERARQDHQGPPR
jgi:uncharacterized DUF497 family protein